jgi:hypothetical protein
MEQLRAAFRSAPPSVRRAGLVAVFQAIYAVLASVAGALHATSPEPAQLPPALLLPIGLLLLLPLFLLPVTVVRSRYPLRRYREALFFQALLCIASVASLVTDPGLGGAIVFASVVAVVAFLRAPSARAYIAQSEGRFKVTETAG